MNNKLLRVGRGGGGGGTWTEGVVKGGGVTMRGWIWCFTVSVESLPGKESFKTKMAKIGMLLCHS